MSTTFEIPTLRTDRLTLRAFQAADLDALATMQANPEVRRFLGGNLLTRAEAWSSMERNLGQWALRGYGMFAVDVEGHCAGWAGVLHPLEWPEPELAYSLDQPFWGRGIATEAVRAAREWAFARLDVVRLASFIMRGQCAIGARGGETWRGARWHDYNTRLRCGLVGASARPRGY